MTGAMLPDGADTVVKVEDTDGGTVLVRIDRGAEPGTWIRRRGEDLARGQLVLTAGTVLTARRIGLLAASGHRDVLVRPRPRVAVVSTEPSSSSRDSRWLRASSTTRTATCSPPPSPWPAADRHTEAASATAPTRSWGC